MEYNINDESIVYVLKLIQPKLEYLVNLSKKANLAQALKDLQSRDNESSFDTGEFEELIRNYEDLQSEYKGQQANAERIYGVITDLLIDKFKFKGQNAKEKVPELLQHLDKYDFANIVRIFQD
uniref:Type I site-specific deoxyribonuclease n=1 Tax=Romanomermis culicivorax TaxID=13658 RepID=A0A915L102_ROMCU